MMNKQVDKQQAPSDKAAMSDGALAKPPSAKPPRRELEKDPRLLHSVFLPGSMYRHMLKEVVGDDRNMLDTALRYVLDVMDELKPRDPVERMLAAQMVQTHVRQMYLTMMSTQQKHLKWAALMHESADRAANTFRRQMLALAEYRRPPRPARHFTAIGQANIASQQVVQNNGKLENGIATNEQGCVGEPEALPADGGGAGGAAAFGGAGAAVGGQHRPADGGREGGGKPERAAAR